MTDDFKWYVVHVQSGKEFEAKMALERILEEDKLLDKKKHFSDFISKVRVPIYRETIYKNGKKKQVEKKSFPGYICVCMTLISRDNLDLRDFVVSVPFVSRFLVHSEKDELPLPLKSSEVKNILQDENEDVVENGMVNIDFDIGQKVLIVSGPFNNFSGNIKEIYPDKGKVSVNIEIFGRETPVEIDHYKVKKQ